MCIKSVIPFIPFEWGIWAVGGGEYVWKAFCPKIGSGQGTFRKEPFDHRCTPSSQWLRKVKLTGDLVPRCYLCLPRSECARPQKEGSVPSQP